MVNQSVDAATTIAEQRSLYNAAEDYAIKQEITGKFFDENFLLEVSTDVYKRRVMLTGAVKTIAARKRAEELARQTVAVRDVFNEIQITDDGGVKSVAEGLYVEAKLKAKLLTADSIRSINYRWRAMNGVVYLLGTAGSPEELDRVMNIARETDGVHDVVSHMIPHEVDSSEMVARRGSTAASLTRPHATGKEPLEGPVLSVQNGDTITVLLGRKRQKVRLIGSNAPEVGTSPRGKQAREFLSRLVRGKTVRLETDAASRDRSQPLLAYVYIGDVFVNLELIRQGHAVARTRPPNLKYGKEYQTAQLEAREAGRGIWAQTPSYITPTPCSAQSKSGAGC